MNIVITGSTKGIGCGLGQRFLESGHMLLINGRDETRTYNALEKMRADFPGRTVISYTCDVSDYNSVVKMYDYAVETLGSVDIWINNAGMSQNFESFQKHDTDIMNQIIDVNIKGVLNGTRIACERMIKTGGYIYNMEGFGSDGRKMKRMSIYGMTKRALRYFTESTALEMKGTSVKIGTLSPGMVITDLLMDSIPEDPQLRANTIKIYNILGDRVEDVTRYLVKKILENRKNGAKIAWLTTPKIMFRFLTQPFVKREIVTPKDFSSTSPT